MPLKVLVVGASICGPAFAAMLQAFFAAMLQAFFAAMLQAFDHRHHITVVERAPTLRATGRQIDLKTRVIPIMEKLSLIDRIRSHSVAEQGLEMVDTNGKSVMRFDFDDKDANRSDLALAVSSEYEIMRGDLVKVLYEFSLEQRASLETAQAKEGGLEFEFGRTISEVTHTGNGADVTFSDGQKGQYDLVVGADG
jgi:2-polyprenyl-6-methoxyphenol hydroxylase-like FAD-dependent oxidoreductase